MYRSIPCKSFGFLDLGLWDEVSFGILIVKAKIIGCRTKEGVGRIKDSPSDAAPQGGNESSLVWIRYWGGESQPDELVKGLEKFSFIDCYSGYNQIRMAPEDAKKTAFRTPKGHFSNKVMPFGLKNAGATYQRAMTTIFQDMMHKEI